MIDCYITEQIKRRNIILYDFIGDNYIDPNLASPGLSHERARFNRLKHRDWSLRMCELLSDGDFNEFEFYSNLVIQPKYLVHYWWNNIADPDAFLDEVMGDLFEHYKDRMLPKENEPVDLGNVFEEVLKKEANLYQRLSS